MKTGRSLFLLLIIALAFTLSFNLQAKSEAGAVTAVQANQSELAEIKAYASSLDRYIRRYQKRARYFADFSSPEDQNAKPRWQEVKTRSALDKAWQDGKTYTSSNVWFHPTGELAVALFTFSSPSGDWVQDITNYYRKDGTLAKSNAELRTFMGDVVRIYDRYYDSKARLIKEETRFLDLKTRRPKRVKRDEFMDMEAPLYAKTSALPFYGLLKKG